MCNDVGIFTDFWKYPLFLLCNQAKWVHNILIRVFQKPFPDFPVKSRSNMMYFIPSSVIKSDNCRKSWVWLRISSSNGINIDADKTKISSWITFIRELIWSLRWFQYETTMLQWHVWHWHLWHWHVWHWHGDTDIENCPNFSVVKYVLNLVCLTFIKSSGICFGRDFRFTIKCQPRPTV